MADGGGSLALGLTLAICSAAAINLGFLLQHRGLARLAPSGGGTLRLLRRASGQPVWLVGQALGAGGFAAQVIAVAIAPLTLVQAFAAGGVALSLPAGVLLFRQRVGRTQALAVVAIAAALASLPIGLPPVHEALSASALGVIVAGVLGVAICAARSGQPAWLAIAAGLSYGSADAAIKAISVLWVDSGSGALLTVWLPVAVLATFTGFLTFQAALRGGDAVGAVTLMSALAALVALGCGLIALDEPFGVSPAATGLHLAAVAVVLVCVRPLAAAQAELELELELDVS